MSLAGGVMSAGVAAAVNLLLAQFNSRTITACAASRAVDTLHGVPPGPCDNESQLRIVATNGLNAPARSIGAARDVVIASSSLVQTMPLAWF